MSITEKSLLNAIEEKNKEENDQNKTEIRYSHFSTKFIPAKTSIFIYIGCKYILMSYLIPFLISTGMNKSQAGIITCIRYLSQVVGGVILGAIMDRTKKYTLITVTSITMTIISIVGLVFVPFLLYGTQQDWEVAINISKNTSSSLIQEHISSASPTSYATESIFIVSLFCILYAFFDGNLYSSIDSLLLFYCDKYGKTNSYNWQRLWASLGNAIVPFLASLALENLQIKVVSEYFPVILVFCIGQPLLYISWYKLLTVYAEKDRLTNVEKKFDVKVTKHTLKQPRLILCIGLQILFGYANALTANYILLFMKQPDMINGSVMVLAYTIFNETITSAIGGMLVGKLQRMSISPFYFVAVGCLMYAAGFFAYYFTTNACYLIIINILPGMGYPLFLYPVQKEIYKITPKECLSFIIGLCVNCYGGVGSALGALFGGVMYDVVGARIMFLMASILFQFIAILLCIYSIFDTKSERKKLSTSEIKQSLI